MRKHLTLIIALCQKRYVDKHTSTSHGRIEIITAAEIRTVGVLVRLQSISIGQHLKYHMDNKWYKAYNLQKRLCSTLGKRKIHQMEKRKHIDFMSLIRKVKTIGEAVESARNIILNTSNYILSFFILGDVYIKHKTA